MRTGEESRRTPGVWGLSKGMVVGVAYQDREDRPRFDGEEQEVSSGPV